MRTWAPVILCAALALPLAAEIVDRIAATVDDVAIPESAVRRAMVLSALSPEPGESPEVFRVRVLDALIDQRLQYDEALRFGPPAPDAADIEAALKRLKERLAAEGKDPARELAAAGVTPEELRATVERQLVVTRYLQERFRPIAFADEERARQEYEERYVPERRASGLAVPPFDQVSEEMRTRSQERVFEEEVSKWMKELRENARVAIYKIPMPVPAARTPVLLSTAALVTTPTPTPTPTPSHAGSAL
jgi:parvulin-like peptidyl-prolyl isomerase